jgi:hypothetical protein
MTDVEALTLEVKKLRAEVAEIRIAIGTKIINVEDEKAMLVRHAKTIRTLVADKLNRSVPYREALRTGLQCP